MEDEIEGQLHHGIYTHFRSHTVLHKRRTKCSILLESALQAP
jgi:hypothetical protein